MKLSPKYGPAPEFYNPSALLCWTGREGGTAVRFISDLADEEPLEVSETPEEVTAEFNAAMRDEAIVTVASP